MSKKRWGIITSIVFIVSLLVFAYIQGNRAYQKKKRAYYTPKIATMQLFIRQEKDWIIENQGEQGPIYMNYNEKSPSTGAGDVNPYFASFAAQGLLAGEVNEADMQAVGDYLAWHMVRFLKEDGELSDYTLIDGELMVNTEADSLDSYIAVFISLLTDYLEQGGTVAADQYEVVIDLALNKLDLLLLDGLTTVDFESNLIYLMDNLEVIAAYRDLLAIGKDEELNHYLEQRLAENKQAITDQLWNQQTERYEIGISSNGQIIETIDVEQLYPDAIAQIYNIAFDVHPKGIEHSAVLYKEFTDNVPLARLETKQNDEFFWSELFYISALMGDTARAENYFAAYEEITAQNRDYPFHTATAGWAIKAADALAAEYAYRIERSVLEDFFDRAIFSNK